jgi:hypothetical protein
MLHVLPISPCWLNHPNVIRWGKTDYEFEVGWMTAVWFLAGEGIFSLCHSVQSGCGDHLASYPVDTGGPFLGVEWLGCEADHSPSSAKVKNAWSCTSTLLCLHGSTYLSMWYIVIAWYLVKQRDNFTFTSLCNFLHFPCTFLLGPYILLSTLFWNMLNCNSSLSVRPIWNR